MSKDQAKRAAQGNSAGATQAKAEAPKLGNVSVAEEATAKGREQQAQMLQFIETRLAHASSVQQREIQQTFPHPEREWGHLVADAHKQDRGLTKPEPTEWNRVAEAYREAAQAIARGDLARGGALLRSAFDEDRKAYARLSNLVHASESERPHTNPWHAKVTGAPVGSVHVPKAITTLSETITAHYDAVKDPSVRPDQERTAPLVEAEVDDKGKDEKKKEEAPKTAKAEAPKAPVEVVEEVAAKAVEEDKEKEPPKNAREDRLAAAARRAAEAKKAVATAASGSVEGDLGAKDAPKGAPGAEKAPEPAKKAADVVAVEKAPEAVVEKVVEVEAPKLEEASKKADEEKERAAPVIAKAAAEETQKATKKA